MNPRDLPVVHHIVESGADDNVYDAFMLTGPLLLVLVAVRGRTLVTQAVVGAYLLAFSIYVVYNAIAARGGKGRSGPGMQS